MQLGARLSRVPGAHAILFGPVIAELLDLSSAARTELFHDGLLLGRAGIEKLENLPAHLGMTNIHNTTRQKSHLQTVLRLELSWLQLLRSSQGEKEKLFALLILPTFLLCCSLVDCWFRRLSISMSK